MQNSILFVDDEPQVLHGLRRMLHSRSREWGLHFAASGEEALEMLRATPVDVVVSDMRMPGMDGIALLTEVKRLYPWVARVALSGHMDEQMILGSTKVVHQFLSKPCGSEELTGILARLLALRRYLAEESLVCLSTRLDHVPSLPKMFVAIQEELLSPRCSLKKIGEIIFTDVGMSAKILQLVNSSFFGMYTKVTSPAQAVNLLGTETVKALVLHVQVFSQYNAKHCPRFSLSRLSRHSMLTATLAKRLCSLENASPEVQDNAFLAGLVHDVGKLVFAVNCPDLYDEMLEMAPSGNKSFSSLEQEVLGASHAQLGAYILGLWGMADPVVEAVAFHHTPQLSTVRHFVPLTALHAANALIIALQPEGVTGKAEGVNMEYLHLCGLTNRIGDWEQKARELMGMSASAVKAEQVE